MEPIVETLEVKGLSITLTRKAVKNAHLSVHPPDGRISLVAPIGTRTAVANSFILTKIAWIKQQQEELARQERETPRENIARESHYLWGKRYLLQVREADEKPHVYYDHKNLILTVRPEATAEKRAEVMYEWYKGLLHEAIPPLIFKWEKQLQVSVEAYFLQKMKTKWGSCNYKKRHIRINTELVKKPKDLLEYIIVHEMAHLIVSNHSEEFIQILDQHYPNWRDARKELNDLPIT